MFQGSEIEHVATNKPEVSKSTFTSNRLIRPALIVAALVAGSVAVAPYFFSGLHPRLIAAHDLANHFYVMNEFEKSLRSGVLYPRWIADANNGYGIVTMNYYPPGFYYLTAAINLVVDSWHTTLFIIAALAVAGSAVALYFLSRTFFGRSASATASVVYALLPYHQLDLYWRGALPEFVGFVFLPMIFYFAYKVGSGGQLRHYAGLGLFYGLHLLTQLPVTLLLSYTLAFYALAWAAKERDLKIAFRIGLGLILGLVLSAVYWVPAALESNQVFEYTSAIFPYHASYINPVPTQDTFNQLVQKTLKLNVLMWLAAIAILRHRTQTLSKSFGREATDPARRSLQVRLWLIMCGATLFMTTSYSYDISKLLPKIQVAVPPFRWLAISSMFAALLVAVCVDSLSSPNELSRPRLWAYRLVGAGVITLNLAFCAGSVIKGAPVNGSFRPHQNYVESSFTPRDSTRPEELPDTPLAVTYPDSGAIEIIRWDPQYREVHVRVNEPSRVRLKTYNFPGWVARVDGSPAPMLSDDDGIQIVEVPAGVHRIEASFGNTIPRSAGALLSVLGLLGVIGLAAADRVRESSRMTAQAASERGGLATAPLRTLAPLLGLVLIGVVILLWVSNRGSSGGAPANDGGSSAAPPGSQAPGRQAQSQNEPGTVRLHLDGVPSIPIALDDGALSELMNALVAKDGAKVDALVESGRLLRVPNDTSVRVLESAAGKTKVRILEGEHMMAEGWVSERWIR